MQATSENALVDGVLSDEERDGLATLAVELGLSARDLLRAVSRAPGSGQAS